MKLCNYFSVFLAVSGLVNVTESCQDNCVCYEDEAECTVMSCSLLELDTTYGVLTLHGLLCPEQRRFLEEIVDVTFITLKDDYCNEIPNCR